MSTWYLEGFIGNDGTMRKVPLSNFPQVVGRDQSLECTIFSPGVSRQHAKVEECGTQLRITDLHSSNGTYVNHKRINDATLVQHGDVIHFGELELRLIDQRHSQEHAVLEKSGSETVFISQAELSETFPSGVNELEQMLDKREFDIAFQPILMADGVSRQGFEALGRGANPNISPSPLTLFKIAESVGLEVRLSTLLRDIAVEIAAKYNLRGALWLNSHPREMLALDKVIASLHGLRQRFPQIPLVFEVHEQCVTDSGSLVVLKNELHKLGIRFAFDDFGVGQSRIMELVAARPDIIKFDKVLIEGLDDSCVERINLLRHLKDMASELEIQALAECVENEQEFKVCERIGFDLYQGYYFAKPQPAQHFSN